MHSTPLLLVPLLAALLAGCGPRGVEPTGDPTGDGAPVDAEAGLAIPPVATLSDAGPGDASDGSTPTVDRQVAITIDDLPIAFHSSHRDDAHRRDVVKRLCDSVGERELPVTGFVVGSHHADQPELLELWESSGIELGNHTWTHPRMKKVGLARYLADLDRGHAFLAKRLPDGATIPFRYPFLYRGFDPANRDAVRARLAELGSPVAPVTIDTYDWLYTRDYSKALARGDTAATARSEQAWRWNLEEATERAEWLARSLFDREPPQILLLHANEINARNLGGYLDWLEGRGYRFVTLATALEDPAYHEEDRSVVPTGDSHWLRLRRSRQMVD